MVNLEQEIDLQAYDEEPIRALHRKQFLWNQSEHCTLHRNGTNFFRTNLEHCKVMGTNQNIAP